MIPDPENDLILDNLLYTSGDFAPVPTKAHKLTYFHSYANLHRVDQYSSANPKFAKISGCSNNFAVVTDDGQLLLGRAGSDVTKIIDELQPGNPKTTADGRSHGIVCVAVSDEYYNVALLETIYI
ncbi:unnamed protein product [Ambrosiozyma monospora]|uniref:Unnamed protein product n=1 Tax=Ambrosiozyma monospora TaxID=43982 RepID=A0ACB5TZ55_AMBMO|nr:unnamed protein product [Ambrosiozyma monospora]